MNIKRLEILIPMLVDLQETEDNIDVRTWFIDEAPCCIIGHAVTRPEFQAQGFTSGIDKRFIALSPEFEGHFGYDAVMEFFDISYQLALKLFSNEMGCYLKISDVITRIQQTIQEGKPE